MATMDAKPPLFLDTNVLVYASVKEAPEHVVVRGFVEKQLALGTPLFISRQVLREYLAVLSRPQPNRNPVPKAELLAWLATWRDRCQVLDDNAAMNYVKRVVIDTETLINAAIRVYSILVWLTQKRYMIMT